MDSGVECGHQQVEGSGDVGEVGSDWVFDGAGNAGQGRFMEDEINAVACAGAALRILDGALDEVDAGEVFKIGELAGNEVVDAANRGSLGEQSAGNVGADKTRNSGDQISRHKVVPMRSSAFVLRYSDFLALPYANSSNE